MVSVSDVFGQHEVTCRTRKKTKNTKNCNECLLLSDTTPHAGIFGGTNVGPLGGGFDGGGWETNTLVSDTTTVICLDDYHLNDRAGRKVTQRTALDLAENNFDLMYEQLKARSRVAPSPRGGGRPCSSTRVGEL